MALHPDLVGRRVVVRSVLRGQTGPSGGPAFTDALGVLEAWSSETLSVRHQDGRLLVIAQADVATAKPVPPRASVRQRISPEQLQRVCAAGWRAPVEERLGDWLMRAGADFTGRSSSTLAAGDPGLPVGEAERHVAAFHAEHGGRALVQVVVGSPWPDTFKGLGWVHARPSQPDALVQVASIAQARRGARARAEPPDVEITDTLGDDWLRLYGRTEGYDGQAVRAVLTSGDSVGFATVGSPAHAIGRGVVNGDWLGISAVEVEAAYRRTGVARAVVDALLEWGASQGALSVYLQCLPDNTAAIALYAGYGFTTHHRYRYLTPGV